MAGIIPPVITILSKENSIFRYNVTPIVSGLQPNEQYELWMFGLDPYFWEHFSHYFMDTIFHYQYLSPSPPLPLSTLK